MDRYPTDEEIIRALLTPNNINVSSDWNAKQAQLSIFKKIITHKNTPSKTTLDTCSLMGGDDVIFNCAPIMLFLSNYFYIIMIVLIILIIYYCVVNAKKYKKQTYNLFYN